MNGISALSKGPTGQKITLQAGVYEIGRQYQLPQGTELVGAGTGPRQSNRDPCGRQELQLQLRTKRDEPEGSGSW